MSWMAVVVSIFLTTWPSYGELKLPNPAPLTDQVEMLSASERSALADRIRELKDRTGVELSVLIVESLQGYDVADFSYEVFSQWKLGKKGEDKGLLLVIAPKDKKMRLEVGYGLEGNITDVISRRILENVLRPNFRNGNFAQGIEAAIGAIEAVANGDTAQLEKSQKSRSKQILSWIEIVAILVFLLPALLASRLSRYRRRGYSYGGWSGGGGGWGGGSSWGGGGGSFGGGGASSDW